MIADFADRWTADIFHGVNSAAARRTCPPELHPIAAELLDNLHWADNLNELRHPPDQRLEALTGSRRGQHSLRINRRYRLCFVWNQGNVRAVEIVDYHR